MHCSEGPVPRAAGAVVRAFMLKELRPWEVRWEEDFQGIPAALRGEAAALLGGRAEDISLSPSTSTGLVAVAQGFPWRPGDEVLAPLGEFPSNAWPWLALKARGVTFREVPLWEGHRAGAEAWSSLPPTAEADPEARLIAALGPRTRILAVSWVRFQDGLKLDLQRLGKACRERGVHLVVDGIQAAGTVPVDLDGRSRPSPRAATRACWRPRAWASSGRRTFLDNYCHLREPGSRWSRLRTSRGPPRTSTAPGCRTAGPWSPAGRICCRPRPSWNPSACSKGWGSGHRRPCGRAPGPGSWRRWRLPWAVEGGRLRGLLKAGRLGPSWRSTMAAPGADHLQSLLRAGYHRGIFASVREGYLRVAFHGFHTEADVDRIATQPAEAGLDRCVSGPVPQDHLPGGYTVSWRIGWKSPGALEHVATSCEVSSPPEAIAPLQALH